MQVIEDPPGLVEEIRKRIRRKRKIWVVWDMEQFVDDSFRFHDLSGLSGLQREDALNDWHPSVLGCLDELSTKYDAVAWLSFIDFIRRFGTLVYTADTKLAWYVSPKLLLAAVMLFEQSPETFMKIAEAAETPEMFLQLAGVELP